MAMCSKILECAVAALLAVCPACAQRIPADYSYRGMTFRGTLFLPSTAVFNDCHFETDSIVLERSFGAVFRNCTFESRSDVLYMAAEGSGIVLVDCIVTGPQRLQFAVKPQPADRNYMTGLKMNGLECESDESANVIELDGLEMGNAVRKPDLGKEILFARIRKDGDRLTMTGLDSEMFVGWASDSPAVSIEAAADPGVFMLRGHGDAVVSAYTEYGIEASIAVHMK